MEFVVNWFVGHFAVLSEFTGIFIIEDIRANKQWRLVIKWKNVTTHSKPYMEKWKIE